MVVRVDTVAGMKDDKMLMSNASNGGRNVRPLMTAVVDARPIPTLRYVSRFQNSMKSGKV